MSESKANLVAEVERMRRVVQAAAFLLVLVDEVCEPVEPKELMDMVKQLRRALHGDLPP